jgi:hypothetical protein
MTHLPKTLTVGLLAATAVALAACGGGSSSGSGEKTGIISLGVSDGPVHDANKVCIAFNAVEFKGEGPSFAEPLDDIIFNLLNFQGDNVAPLLFNHELPAGDYQWIRLGVNATLGDNGGADDMDLAGTECVGTKSYLVTKTAGTLHNMYIPSGAETGLKLVGGFTVPAGGSADFTAEFDLMKSVTAPNGLSPDVIFRPTIRLVNNVEVGTLTGEVAGDLIPPEACDASVYVFNDGVTPNPIGSDPELDPDALFDPIATAMVNEQTDLEGQVSYHYTVGFLLAVDENGNSPGNYEVAFTCDGMTFEPVDGKPAEIFAQQLTEVDFP